MDKSIVDSIEYAEMVVHDLNKEDKIEPFSEGLVDNYKHIHVLRIRREAFKGLKWVIENPDFDFKNNFNLPYYSSNKVVYERFKKWYDIFEKYDFIEKDRGDL